MLERDTLNLRLFLIWYRESLYVFMVSQSDQMVNSTNTIETPWLIHGKGIDFVLPSGQAGPPGSPSPRHLWLWKEPDPFHNSHAGVVCPTNTT